MSWRTGVLDACFPLGPFTAHELTEHQPPTNQVVTLKRVTNERFLQLGQVVAGQFSSVRRAVNKPLACAVTITVTTARPDDETDRPTGGVRYVFSGLCQRLSTGAIADASSMETAPPRVITIIIIIVA